MLKQVKYLAAVKDVEKAFRVVLKKILTPFRRGVID